MFTLQFNKDASDKFRQIIDIYYHLKVENINLTITLTEVVITGIDQSKSSILFLTLPKDFFQTYTVTQSNNIIISVELLYIFLKSLTKNIELIISQITDNYIQLLFQYEQINQTFKIPLLDIEFQQLNNIANNITYQVKYQIKSEYFKNIINNISLIESEDITIKINNQKLIFNSKGDLGENTTEFNAILIKDYLNNKCKDTTCISYQDIEINIEETFSLEMIKKCVKQTNFCDFGPNISLNHDIPLQLEYIIKPSGNLKIFIAPKIGN